MDMEYNIKNSDDISLVSVQGRLDSTTHDDLMAAITGLLVENRSKIVVELSKTEYISSAGWSVFISNVKSARIKKGDIYLCGMNDRVKEVFELLELHHIIVSFPTLREAMSRFGAAQ